MSSCCCHHSSGYRNNTRGGPEETYGAGEVCSIVMWHGAIVITAQMLAFVSLLIFILTFGLLLLWRTSRSWRRNPSSWERPILEKRKMCLQQLGMEQQTGNRIVEIYSTEEREVMLQKKQRCHNVDHSRGELWHHPGPVSRVKGHRNNCDHKQVWNAITDSEWWTHMRGQWTDEGNEAIRETSEQETNER